jgi:hypothetical protein
LGDDARAECGSPPQQPAADNGGGRRRGDFETVAPQQVGQRQERLDDRVSLGVEVAQDGRKLRQHEGDEEDQDTTGRQQNEGGILQRVSYLSAQRLGARSLAAKRLQNMIERA